MEPTPRTMTPADRLRAFADWLDAQADAARDANLMERATVLRHAAREARLQAATTGEGA